MSTSTTSRRRFLLLVTAGVAGVGGFVTRGRWWPSSASTTVVKAPLDLAGSMHRLSRVVGPWPAKDDEIANEFLSRFLHEKRLADYQAQEAVVISLANTFSASDIALDDLDLSGLDEEQRNFVLGFSRQLYALDEVRAYIRNYPPLGTCIGDLTRHTLTPT